MWRLHVIAGVGVTLLTLVSSVVSFLSPSHPSFLPPFSSPFLLSVGVLKSRLTLFSSHPSTLLTPSLLLHYFPVGVILIILISFSFHSLFFPSFNFLLNLLASSSTFPFSLPSRSTLVFFYILPPFFRPSHFLPSPPALPSSRFPPG